MVFFTWNQWGVLFPRWIGCFSCASQAYLWQQRYLLKSVCENVVHAYTRLGCIFFSLWINTRRFWSTYHVRILKIENYQRFKIFYNLCTTSCFCWVCRCPLKVVLLLGFLVIDNKLFLHIIFFEVLCLSDSFVMVS